MSFFGFSEFEEQQLGDDQRGHMVFDLASNEDDALAKQARIDVERPFAAIRLLDDDGHEAGGEVEMVGHKRSVRG